MAEANLEKIQKKTEELLELLGVKATVSVALEEEVAQINLETDETGMLIGYHGETLEAMQLILSLMIARELGEFVRVSLEIGDYRKNREDYLQHLVDQTKERVLAEQRPVSLQNLKSWERRIVHLMLQDDQEVTTESEGEGRERVLTIKPKSSDDAQGK